jgi:hypothetical protein
MTKSPVLVMDEIVSTDEPLFVTVTTLVGLVVPTVWALNVRLVGATRTIVLMPLKTALLELPAL